LSPVILPLQETSPPLPRQSDGRFGGPLPFFLSPIRFADSGGLNPFSELLFGPNGRFWQPLSWLVEFFYTNTVVTLLGCPFYFASSLFLPFLSLNFFFPGVKREREFNSAQKLPNLRVCRRMWPMGLLNKRRSSNILSYLPSFFGICSSISFLPYCELC